MCRKPDITQAHNNRQARHEEKREGYETEMVNLDKRQKTRRHF